MCYCVYIATGEPQETSTFTPNVTELYLEEPDKKELENLSGKFAKRHIYWVGAYTRCSCGFQLPLDQLDNPNWIDARRSVQKLIDFIKEVSLKGGIQLYCCWAGNTAPEPEAHIYMQSGLISLENYFDLTENQLITFQA